MIIVHQNDRIDLGFHSGIQFRDVVPNPAVAGEAEHRSIRRGTLGAHRGGQPPTQRSRTTDEGLIGVFEVEHGAVQTPECPVSETRIASEGR